MKTSLFSFDLPDELIASEPPEVRGTCRLMFMNGHASTDGRRRDPQVMADFEHRSMSELPSLVEPGTVMVFNDTRVRKARLFAANADHGKCGEFLFLQPVSAGVWKCLVDKARKKKQGSRWLFPGGIQGTITAEPSQNERLVTLEPVPDETWFDSHGHMPLPPYMRRKDTRADIERYQTVYARGVGSAAAPTAGLHFTQAILDELTDREVELLWLTLDIGLGTFVPVRSECVEEHHMHTEYYKIPEHTANRITKAKKEGRKVLAVGTTSVRTLESAWDGDRVRSGSGSTNIFIYPGYRFKVINQLFTNFHTPRSSLLMLVAAFCGLDNLLAAYTAAVEHGYRFYSYGDAMLVEPSDGR